MHLRSTILASTKPANHPVALPLVFAEHVLFVTSDLAEAEQWKQYGHPTPPRTVDAITVACTVIPTSLLIP